MRTITIKICQLRHSEIEIIMEKVLFLYIVFLSTSLFAHGMNKLGPNGGYIKMPANYHIEVVKDHQNIKVYFLDINFRTLKIESSSVSVIFKGKINVPSRCSIENKYLSCLIPKVGLNKFKEMVVTSTKDNGKAFESIYKLPLHLEN